MDTTYIRTHRGSLVFAITVILVICALLIFIIHFFFPTSTIQQHTKSTHNNSTQSVQYDVLGENLLYNIEGENIYIVSKLHTQQLFFDALHSPLNGVDTFLFDRNHEELYMLGVDGNTYACGVQKGCAPGIAYAYPGYQTGSLSLSPDGVYLVTNLFAVSSLNQDTIQENILVYNTIKHTSHKLFTQDFSVPQQAGTTLSFVWLNTHTFSYTIPRSSTNGAAYGVDLTNTSIPLVESPYETEKHMTGIYATDTKTQNSFTANVVETDESSEVIDIAQTIAKTTKSIIHPHLIAVIPNTKNTLLQNINVETLFTLPAQYQQVTYTNGEQISYFLTQNALYILSCSSDTCSFHEKDTGSTKLQIPGPSVHGQTEILQQGNTKQIYTFTNGFVYVATSGKGNGEYLITPQKQTIDATTNNGEYLL